MSFEKNVYGANHPDNTYNLENEERDRRNLEKENREKSPNGNRPFVPIEEVHDENAESDIYDRLEANSEKEREDREIRNEFEFDKFGFVQVLQDYFNKVSKDKREELLQHTSEFLSAYRKILDNAKDEKTALKEANKAFYKIIGKEISGYDDKTGKISFDLERASFINVRDKKAPISAIKLEYDKHGRPVDTDKKIKETNKKARPANPGLKLPWRH